MSRKTNYFQAPQVGPVPETGILCDVPAEYVPFTLSSLEIRKDRIFFISELDFSNGYQGICKMQWGLLMDASERITRALFYQMGYPRDVLLAADGFPEVELPEATLFAIRTRLGDPGDATIYSRVEAIRLLLANADTLDDEMLAELVKIAALLAV